MSLHPKRLNQKKVTGILVSFLFFNLFTLSELLYAEENAKVIVNQAEQRLGAEESLSLDLYTLKPPKTLKDAVDDYNSDRNKKETKPLKIDIQKALEAFDESDPSNRLRQNSDNQSSNQISIADARIRALKNNLLIKVIRIDPLIAAADVREEQAKFDNILFAYAKYAQLDAPKASSDKVKFTSDNPSLNDQEVKLSNLEKDVNTFQLEAGIKVPLRSGGFVTLSSPLENKVSNGKFKSDEYRSALRFSISQPLLRNAGLGVNEASIRVAEFSQQAVELKTRLQSIRIIATVDKAYWALYEAWGQLDVRRQQFEYANQNLAMVKHRVQEGISPRVEINRAEIGVADRMDSLIVAETNLKLAERQIRFYMNDIDTNYMADPLIPNTSPNLVKYEFNRSKLLNDALSGRVELLEQELKIAADLTKIDYLENQTLPIFTIDYQYGALSNTNNSFGNSYRNVLDGQFKDWSVGLKFEMPLTNEASKARLESSIQQRNQKLATKTLQVLTVKKEIYDALDYVDQNWQRIIAARQQVLIAGLNYEAELKQFNEGLRTMTEVLETLTRLGEAQIKEVHAIGEYQISLVDTAYATGTLLGYSKLDFN
ncbi:MAG: TolC family protein [Methylotenera sp.]|uniref:TolC family protein n=1 Tax=Methylotenera sp. TaxID=2051956 RepID=UPI002487D56D|nr:TolC family protein [Methylotenera sp.]MDI1310077.1 TolC family protein [Methylotenera sp.]